MKLEESACTIKIASSASKGNNTGKYTGVLRDTKATGDDPRLIRRRNMGPIHCCGIKDFDTLNYPSLNSKCTSWRTRDQTQSNLQMRHCYCMSSRQRHRSLTSTSSTGSRAGKSGHEKRLESKNKRLATLSGCIKATSRQCGKSKHRVSHSICWMKMSLSNAYCTLMAQWIDRNSNIKSKSIILQSKAQNEITAKHKFSIKYRVNPATATKASASKHRACFERHIALDA